MVERTILFFFRFSRFFSLRFLLYGLVFIFLFCNSCFCRYGTQAQSSAWISVVPPKLYAYLQCVRDVLVAYLFRCYRSLFSIIDDTAEQTVDIIRVVGRRCHLLIM